jgi:hypothetical protein
MSWIAWKEDGEMSWIAWKEDGEIWLRWVLEVWMLKVWMELDSMAVRDEPRGWWWWLSGDGLSVRQIPL